MEQNSYVMAFNQLFERLTVRLLHDIEPHFAKIKKEEKEEKLEILIKLILSIENNVSA